MTGHSIELVLDPDGIRAEFICEVGAEGECHQTCAFGCEIWDAECMENHPRELIAYCNPIEFMTNGENDWYELYAGGETEPRSGPIIFEWQGDWYGWRYDDAEQLNTAAETQP